MTVTDILGSAGLDSMKQKYVGVAVRLVLTSTGVTLAGKADDSFVNEIAGALIVIVTAVWSMYEKRTARQEKLTGFQLAGVTENQVKAMVADPAIPTPSVNTSPDAIPTLTLFDVERFTRPGSSR